MTKMAESYHASAETEAKWPGIPSDLRYGRDSLRPLGSAAKPGLCLAEVSEPPHHFHSHQCPRRAVQDGLCRQHIQQRDRWLRG